MTRNENGTRIRTSALVGATGDLNVGSVKGIICKNDGVSDTAHKTIMNTNINKKYGAPPYLCNDGFWVQHLW